MTNYIGHLVTSSAITITTSEEILTVPSSHISYNEVREAIIEGDFNIAIALADAARTINTFGEGKVVVKDGVVFYNGLELHNSLTRRIGSMISDGFDVNPMVQFLENLMENPSGRAVKELYTFLECNDLPITPDGHFLSYKNVGEDYTDKHSGTFDNSIGMVCSMPRNEVMDDPNQTCSSGLHVCSIEYLKGFWGTSGHTMVVKINPRDVVSVPVDYENSKMRVCQYEVVAEHFNGTEDSLAETSVWEEQYDDDDDDIWSDDIARFNGGY